MGRPPSDLDNYLDARSLGIAKDLVRLLGEPRHRPDSGLAFHDCPCYFVLQSDSLVSSQTETAKHPLMATQLRSSLQSPTDLHCAIT